MLDGPTDASTSTPSDGGSTLDTGSMIDASSSVAPEGSAAADTGASCDAAGPTTPALVGAPCIPRQELDPSFAGSSASEISIESNGPECASRVCLSDYFQGRVTCPYGQDSVRTRMATAPMAVPGA